MATPTQAVDQLLATKFFVPVASQPLVARTRLTALLNEGLHRRLTLVCAPTGFGKSTLLAEWVRSLPPPPDGPFVAWVSLDEDDDNPARFGDYIISALDRSFPGVGSRALQYLHAPEGRNTRTGLIALINGLAGSGAEHLLVLDDYHYATDPEIHSALAYVLDHLPPNVHIVISTRSEPPPSLPLSRWRARGELVEVHTDDLRTTVDEGIRFLRYTAGVELPDAESQELIQRTEGWLVGLQLLALSVRGSSEPVSVLEELSGTQEYIVDYLTEEVLRRQPQEVQTFLLSTSILNELNASLCDAVMGYEQSEGHEDDSSPSAHRMGQRGAGEGREFASSSEAGSGSRKWEDSQAILRYLERSNLFLVRLDAQRQWYRYHHLFAEALRYQLEHRNAGSDEPGTASAAPIPLLYRRASTWYAARGRNREAVDYALLASDWGLAVDLIQAQLGEITMRMPAEMPTLRRWFARLPEAVLHAQPRLCIAYVNALFWTGQTWQAFPWLDAAETALRKPPGGDMPAGTEPELGDEPRSGYPEPERERMLGDAIAKRAFTFAAFEEDAERALALCDEACSHLAGEDHNELSIVAWARELAHISLGRATDARANALGKAGHRRSAGFIYLYIAALADVAALFQVEGKLHAAEQTFAQAIALGNPEDRPAYSSAAFAYIFEAELLREWNRLDEALVAASKGLQIAGDMWAPVLRRSGTYEVLVRLHLSRGELDEALHALEGANLTPELAREEGDPQPVTGMQPAGTAHDPTGPRGAQGEGLQERYMHPWCADAERVRLWLARGEVDRAVRWAEQLVRQRQVDLSAYGRPYPAQYRRDCEDVARARVALGLSRLDEALEMLEPVAVRAEEGGRRSHLIEIKLLQALAHSMRSQKGEKGEEEKALTLLEEAVRLGEAEGFIRSFVDEGPRLAALLSRLRARERHSQVSTPGAGTMEYLDVLLAAFEGDGPASLTSKSKRTPVAVKLRGPGAGGAGIADRVLVEPLSERELEVLGLLAEGASNSEIAEQLVLAINTVKRHVSNIFEKLGTSSRTQTIAQARALGLLVDE